MTKLAINEEREEDKYEHTTSFKCWKCDQHGKEVAIDSANVSKLAYLLSDSDRICTSGKTID